MHGKINAPGEGRIFEFFCEESFAPGFTAAKKRQIELLVPTGDKDFHLHLQRRVSLRQRSPRKLNLRESERRASGTQHEGTIDHAPARSGPPPETAVE